MGEILLPKDGNGSCIEGGSMFSGKKKHPALQIEENSFLSALHQDFFGPQLSNGKSGEEWAAQTIQGGPERAPQQAPPFDWQHQGCSSTENSKVHNTVINSTNYLGDSLDWGKQDHTMRIP